MSERETSLALKIEIFRRRGEQKEKKEEFSSPHFSTEQKREREKQEYKIMLQETSSKEIEIEARAVFARTMAKH